MSDSVAVIEARESSLKKFMSAVYTWMVLALAISAVCAYLTASTESIRNVVFGSPFVFYGLIIAELVVVLVFASRLHKMSVGAASAVFILYSALNGITLSVVLLAYTGSSVVRVFLITAGMFACMSVYGRVTKTDLRSAGRYLMMALFGILIASLINLFVRSSVMDWIISLVTVVVFTGLTAYDTQKLCALAEHMKDDDIASRHAIMGALELYLDFINMFLALLRIMGKSRD